MSKLTPPQSNETIFKKIEAAQNLFDILALRGTTADYMDSITHIWEIRLIDTAHAVKIHNEVNNAFLKKYKTLLINNLN